MKKFLTLVLAFMVSVMLVSCSNEKEDNTQPSISPEASEESNIQCDDDLIVKDPDGTLALNDDIDEAIEDALEDLVTDDINAVCDTLENAQLVSGERLAMMGDMVGAITGIKYEDCNVEIYQYEGLAPANAELEGFGITITFDATNGHYALICEESPNCADIVNFFNSLTFG